MQRKVVQHGPSTLTVSLPADWVNACNIRKGDDLTIEKLHNGLFITVGKGIRHGKKSLSVTGLPRIVPKAIAALYKYGYDELSIEYDGSEELSQIHDIIGGGYIGFEIIEETKHRVLVRRVSEPTDGEFKTLFRRIFHFLNSIATEGLDATRVQDKNVLQKLVMRDQNVNKLADFCRRIVNKHGQTDYQCETALYHVIEQLEKIGDLYKEFHMLMLSASSAPPRAVLGAYERTNELFSAYEDLFFRFTLAKADLFMQRYTDTLRNIPEGGEAMRALHLLREINRELYNLIGATMMLNL